MRRYSRFWRSISSFSFWSWVRPISSSSVFCPSRCSARFPAAFFIIALHNKIPLCTFGGQCQYVHKGGCFMQRSQALLGQRNIMSQAGSRPIRRRRCCTVKAAAAGEEMLNSRRGGFIASRSLRAILGGGRADRDDGERPSFRRASTAALSSVGTGTDSWMPAAIFRQQSALAALVLAQAPILVHAGHHHAHGLAGLGARRSGGTRCPDSGHCNTPVR